MINVSLLNYTNATVYPVQEIANTIEAVAPAAAQLAIEALQAGVIMDFFIIAGFFLLLNLVQDLRTKEIDERYNYAILGLALMMGYVINANFLLAFIATGIFMLISKKAFKGVLMEGDYSALDVVLLSFLLIDYRIVPVFFVMFFLLLLLRIILMRILKRENSEAYSSIFFAYIIGVISYYLLLIGI